MTGYFQQWQEYPIDPALWQNEPNERAHPGRQKVYELVKELGAKSILEVACGIGVDYPRYKEAGITYLGVDVTPKFVEEAQRRGVPAKVADARQLPFPDGSFDVVYAKDLFIHLPPEVWRIVLAEMTRVASKQVIILDDGWIEQTEYRPCEKYYGAHDEILTFYNNRYGKKEVLEYAASLGLNVAVYDGGSVKRIHIEGTTITPNIMHPSQITVYHKKEN